MDRGLSLALQLALVVTVPIAVSCGSPAATVPANCQSGSIGMAECTEDAHCQDALDAWLDGMAGPRIPRDRTVIGAECILLTIADAGPDSGSGLACRCALEGGGSLNVGPPGVECLARSRTGNCIWDGAEFPGCDETASNCPELCEELLQKQREDDLRAYETEALGAVCEQLSCKSLARVDDQCFLNMRNVGSTPCDGDLLSSSEPPSSDPAAGAQCPPAPREYHPRSEGEWQGMRVRLDEQAICSGDASCGFALACNDGLCGPCLSDEACASAEVCVLDHCVLEEYVTCRSYTDCAEGLCVLSGYSSGYRGNGDMHAYCLSLSGGSEQ